MIFRRLSFCMLVGCLATDARPATAGPVSLAPLGIQDPAIIPTSMGELEMTLSYADDSYNPFQHIDIDRTVAELPSIRLNLGLGERAELQMRINYLSVNNTEMSSKHGIGDLTMGTKIRLLKQNGPCPPLSIVFATKLPNADDAGDLGTDQTDFFAMAISSYDCMNATFYLNLGLDILADPVYNHSGQDDMFRYGAGVRVPVLSDRLYTLASVEGLDGPTVNRRGAFRLGLQYASDGTWTWHFGASAGFMDLSEDWSVTAGIVRLFALPENW